MAQKTEGADLIEIVRAVFLHHDPAHVCQNDRNVNGEAKSLVSQDSETQTATKGDVDRDASRGSIRMSRRGARTSPGTRPRSPH
jgi:hypothetical protein